jgi:hypothetical protein
MHEHTFLLIVAVVYFIGLALELRTIHRKVDEILARQRSSH